MSLFRASVEHKPGAPRLDGFPLLVYAPKQWGPDVCTEDNGTSVRKIAQLHQEGKDFDAIASIFKTTSDHVRQAVAYSMMR